jgi:CBS domain containing-hemolysin-like protein
VSPPDLVGYVHVKDLLYADDGGHDLPIPDKRIRGLVSVAHGDHMEDALAMMQRSGSHLARVVDSGGATLGVLFLEDVLEELVGEVRDATQRGKATGVRPAPQVKGGSSRVART